MEKTKKAPRYIEGFSESLWKSLVVKSLRIGWVNGLIEASKMLNKSTMKALLVCGIFEDIFPKEDELHTVINEVNEFNFEALCSRETHHGQGLSHQFCDLEKEAVRTAEEDPKLIEKIVYRQYDLWIPPRAYNCFYTWFILKDEIKGGKRDIDSTPWEGMPKVMADSHTIEGKELNQWITLLSGHYSQHRKLGELVQREGWGSVREKVHHSPFMVPIVDSGKLF